MSDYDGDYGGDNDGGDFVDGGRDDLFGNDTVNIGGEELTERQDVFGQTVYVDGDGDVRYTVEQDGDLRGENGVTFTPAEGEIGRESFRGTDGSILTQVTDVTGMNHGEITGGDDVFDPDSGPSGDPQSYSDNGNGDGDSGGGVDYSSVGVNHGSRNNSPSVRRGSGTSMSLGKAIWTVLVVAPLTIMTYGGIPLLFSCFFLETLNKVGGVPAAMVVNGLLLLVLTVVAGAILVGTKGYRKFSAVAKTVLIVIGYATGFLVYLAYLLLV